MPHLFLSCAYRARLDYSVRHRNGQGYGAGLRPRLEHTLCMPRCAFAGSLEARLSGSACRLKRYFWGLDQCFPCS